ncbi:MULTISPECIES: response regulator transcription factor [unclassified Rothia (in: high G+C Gram-positive bacteria)]|uniref:response regulator transcription factor n=1 Tax=unclassified Rothia (in: high G+C Gram-positive bacteria) TaxID=2689056 RepID=UPI00195D90A6|nr:MULTISPECIES: response regulator transcription factor [unclassified Rothia (in: high G+C Gram-positive bacteria)]MBM7051246.1 response regulator transcription factor [Rothia sp. ZJ1223]QRZ61043.1 response regulator transcription factor [Rothia sp. ZJ932]
MSHILIVEDDARISSFIIKGLKSSGYTATLVEDGKIAYGMAKVAEFDLIILDVGLPGMDGFSLMKALRAEGIRTPIIMLTARDSITDTVQGLENGANDYMTKPFQFAELLARVRLRLLDVNREETTASMLTHRDLVLDMRSRQVTVDGCSADLTSREFALLENFMRNKNQVLSREQLLGMVWGMDFDPSSNIVDVYVRALRKKIGESYVSTVRGVGYRFE